MNNNEKMVRVSKLMQAFAAGIDEGLKGELGERVGFQLIILTDPRASYVGNVSREECTAALKDLLNHWDSGMPDIPAHEIN